MSEKTVLLIAFHFPPFRGSSGMQRTLRFAQHLPKFGWQPIVLTTTARAYESRSDSAGNEVPEGLEVHRAFSLDAARQLSVLGRYPSWLATPDRWATWKFRAVPTALRLIRHRKIDVVWSTFPIATAHRIGVEVQRRSGLPWVAEFRDPMWQGDYPPEPRTNRAWKELETDIFSRASRVVVTTPGAAAVYADRFSRFDASRIEVIENGYDEEAFRRADKAPHEDTARSRRPDEPITILHSGVVYRSERDPSHLFAAIASMKRNGLVSSSRLRIVLRASGHESEYQRDIERLDISDIVNLAPPVDYLAALQEMLSADGLLLLQASNCNAQVPAKLYEYVRSGRPILALADPAGDTARTLRHIGIGLIASIDSAEQIERALLQVLDQVQNGTGTQPTPEVVARYSREAQAKQLAGLLDAAASASG
jgi:glycosyltransferase involved in cell wall biosynthesis